MAKLHKFELGWWAIVKEAILFWLPVVALWCLWQTLPYAFCVESRNWVDQNYWFKRLLPCSANGGWFTTSFVSTVTGLNLAIVKLQSFLKAQEDAQARWIADGVKTALTKHPELGADEPSSEQFKQSVQQRSKMYVDEQNAANLEHWAKLNRCAVRTTILGFLCLIFGYSAGVLGLFMLGPVIASWILGRVTAEYLYDRTDTVCDLAIYFTNKLKEQSKSAGGELSERLRKAAEPELGLLARKPHPAQKTK